MADVEVICNIQGLDELEETLKVGGKKASLKFLRSIEKQAAQPVLAAMESTVPIDTGDLLESLAIRSTAGKDGVTVAIGPTQGQNFIGRFAEFGTTKQPAQHWMTRAFAESKDEALTAFIESATESLDEIGK